jgi:isochorismate synthase EntC
MRELHHQTERKYFGAPLVVTIDGDSIAYVCIRNISWDNNGSVIHAGCGIVAESQVEKEWVELNAKINSVRELLGT